MSCPRQPKSAWPIDFRHDFSELCRRARQGQELPVLSARQLIGAATTALSLITVGAGLCEAAAGTVQPTDVRDKLAALRNGRKR